jgi:hypothetical protein
MDALPARLQELAQGDAPRSRAQHLRPWHVSNAVSHCGAGCALGDVGGEWILLVVFASPVIGAAVRTAGR